MKNEEKEENSVGRPEHEPTEESRRVVEAMSGIGVAQKYIAATLDIAEKTLRKHYPKEISVGRAKAHSKIARSIFERAQRSDRLAIFYASTQMGWSTKAEEATSEAMQGFRVHVMPKAEDDYPSELDDEDSEA